jgi:diguanylate cyclase (GGDEF)-like protein
VNPTKAFKHSALGTAVLLTMAVPLSAGPSRARTETDTVGLEQRLPGLDGVERVRLLARLCEAYRSTAPAKAPVNSQVGQARDRLDRSLAIRRPPASLLETRGDARGALDAFRGRNRLQGDLFYEATTRRVAALEAAYHAGGGQPEIERLAAEADMASSAAEQRGILLVLGILLAALLFLLYRRRALGQLQRDLERQVVERTAELSRANALLRELSVTDTLTGLRNRRYVFSSIEADLALAIRGHRDATAAGSAAEGADVVFYLLDLDDFKSVNDEFGHACGDTVLQQVAMLLVETARASDIVVRWGGEEFLILSRHTDRGGAPVFAERLRQRVRAFTFECEGGRTIQRTCSVGFAAFPFVPHDPGAVSWEVVLGLADQMAYVAKRSGRDAWVGVGEVSCSGPASLKATGEVVQALVEAGELRIVSSLEAEGRAVWWDDGADVAWGEGMPPANHGS